MQQGVQQGEGLRRRNVHFSDGKPEDVAAPPSPSAEDAVDDVSESGAGTGGSSLDCGKLGSLTFMPSRLRQLLTDPTLEVISRVCRDLVIRFPVADATEDDIMTLVEPFGPAEYVSHGSGASAAEAKRARMARSFGVPNKSGEVTMEQAAPEATAEMGDPYCHYVRFVEGQDAIRCFLQLNGTVIDPDQQKRTMEEMGQLVEQHVQAHKQAQEENAADPSISHDDPEEQLWADLNEAFKRNAEGRQVGLTCADANASVVMVTCDFFRSAFLDHHGMSKLHLIAGGGSAGGTRTSGRLRWFRERIQQLRVARQSRQSSKGSVKKGGANPVKSQQYELFRGSVSLEKLFHVVSSEGSLPWEEFMFVLNYFYLLFDHDAGQLGVPRLSSNALPAPDGREAWDVVRHALRQVNDDVELVLSWFDVATSEMDLWEGNRRITPGGKGGKAGGLRGALSSRGSGSIESAGVAQRTQQAPPQNQHLVYALVGMGLVILVLIGLLLLK